MRQKACFDDSRQPLEVRDDLRREIDVFDHTQSVVGGSANPYPDLLRLGDGHGPLHFDGRFLYVLREFGEGVALPSVDDNEPPARPQDPLDLAERLREIGGVAEALDHKYTT